MGICWSAVRKWAVPLILGIVLGVTPASAVNERLLTFWSAGAGSVDPLPVHHRQRGYWRRLSPALLAGLALGFIETRLKRIVPDYLYLVVVPVCSLIRVVFWRTPLSVRLAA